MSNVADVYRSNELVGQIIRTKSGSVFTYNEGFYKTHSIKPGGIAYQLPYSRKNTETLGVNLHSYFAGLLPEGLRLKALIRHVKTSEDDLLSLLIAVGADCIGDISVVPQHGSLTEATPTANINTIEQLVFDNLFLQSIAYTKKVGTAEPTIPGVQQKISAAMISFLLRAKQGSQAYIIKLNPPDTPLLVENEAFFLKMAKACGLEVPVSKIIRDRTGATGLLIERFDRIYDKKLDVLIKIHQEDACQLLDRYPADKYRIKCSEIAEALVSTCSAPMIEVARFIRLTAFSYLIGNGDLHGKNISIHTIPNDRIQMTPAYDVVTTFPYGDKKMALKLDGRDDNLKRMHFIDFGKRYGVRELAANAILDEIVENSAAWINRLAEIGFQEKKTEQLQRLISKRRKDLI